MAGGWWLMADGWCCTSPFNFKVEGGTQGQPIVRGSRLARKPILSAGYLQTAFALR